MRYTYNVIKDINKLDCGWDEFGYDSAESFYDRYLYKILRKCIVENFELELDLTGIKVITSDFIRVLCSLIVLEMKRTQIINFHVTKFDDDRKQVLDSFKYYFDLSMKKFKVKSR